MSERHDVSAAYGLEVGSSAIDAHRETTDLTLHDHEHGANDHLASIYESREEQFATVVPFLREGLERGERCVYVADDNTKSAVLDSLSDGGIDVEAARNSGALSILTKGDTYVRTGAFDRDAMIEFWQDSLTRTTDRGDYEGLRAAAEMTWALDERTNLDRLVRYEAVLNTIFPGEEYAVLCQYDRNRFPDAVLSDVVRSHPLIACDGTVCRNVHYDPPADFFDHDRPSLDVDRTIEDLLTREQTRRSLDARERRLAGLTEVAVDLQTADPHEVCGRTIEVASETLDASLGAVWLYDGSEDDLRLVAGSGLHIGSGGPTADRYADLAWTALTEGERIVAEDLDAAGGPSLAGASEQVGLFVPLDRHGVLMVTRPRADGFEGADRDFVDTLAATTAGALDRAERERTLRDRERELERTTEALQGLESVTALIRDVDRAVVRAETRAEIERAACERLTDESPIPFAWIGELDAPGQELVPSEWAGTGRGYLDGISRRIDDGTDHEPSVRSAQSGDVVVASDVIDDLEADGWASRALSAGFHAVASVPLCYDGVQYGVLSAYADRSGAFDGTLESVLGDLGDTIAYAINATQRKRAVLTDAVTELEFETTDPTCPILALARDAECEITLRDVLSRPEDGVFALVTVSADAVDDVLAAAETSSLIDAARPVTQTDEEWLVQLTASGSLIAEDLAEYGARLQSMRAEPTSVSMTVEAPSTHPQTVVDKITNAYAGTELLARRPEREATADAADTKRFWEQLTDRQREVAQVAYYGGYFDRPREQTGEQLADRLDISPQAFHKHLRHIQHSLFATTLEDDS